MARGSCLSCRGYTLIELMIGMGLSVLIVGGMALALQAQERAYQAQGARREELQGLESAAQELQRDFQLAGANLPSWTIPALEPGPGKEGPLITIRYLAEAPYVTKLTATTSDESILPLAANALATAIGGSPWTPLLLMYMSGPITDANATTTISHECFAEIASLRTGQVAARFPGHFVGGAAESVSLLPYRGEIPGFSEFRNSAGVIVDGNLLTILPDGSGRVEESAALPGMVPIGLVGPSGGWMALAESPRFSVPNRGFRFDQYQVGDAARVSVAPVDQVLSPEAEGGSFQPRLVGAVPDPSSVLGDLLTSAAGFRAEVEVPPGSRLFVAPLGEGFPVDPTWQSRADDGHAVIQVAVAAGRNSFNVRGFVVTPAGHGYTVAWFVQVLRRPPALQVEAEWASLGFDVPFRGSTDPTASVLVDGAPVAVAADGSFVGLVAAPPWPTTIVVEAYDLVGNRTSATLSVVGLLDYRQLPWVPIIVGLTLIAGAGLFLLAPRLRPPPVTSHPDDGTLEDLDDR